jgi:hypothetical protein
MSGYSNVQQAALEDRCDGHVARLLHLNHLLSEYNATLSEDDRAKVTNNFNLLKFTSLRSSLSVSNRAALLLLYVLHAGAM